MALAPGAVEQPEEVWNGVIAALDAMGIPAIGFLAMGLVTSKDSTYRVRIVEALGSLAPMSRTAVLLALAAAQDKDPAVRMAAANVVWGLETPRAPKPCPTPAGA